MPPTVFNQSPFDVLPYTCDPSRSLCSCVGRSRIGQSAKSHIRQPLASVPHPRVIDLPAGDEFKQGALPLSVTVLGSGSLARSATRPMSLTMIFVVACINPAVCPPIILGRSRLGARPPRRRPRAGVVSRRKRRVFF